VIADSWQRIGLGGTTAVRATGRLGQDPEAQATFPGFMIQNSASGVPGLRRLHSANVRLPENSFQVGGSENVSRYMNPELDGLIDAYFRTIPLADRIAVMGRILRHVAEQLPVMGIYYNPAPDAFGNRLLNIGIARAFGSVPSWNAHEWDVKP